MSCITISRIISTMVVWFFLSNQPEHNILPNFQNEKNKKKDSIVEPTTLMCYVEASA